MGRASSNKANNSSDGQIKLLYYMAHKVRNAWKHTFPNIQVEELVAEAWLGYSRYSPEVKCTATPIASCMSRYLRKQLNDPLLILTCNPQSLDHHPAPPPRINSECVDLLTVALSLIPSADTREMFLLYYAKSWSMQEVATKFKCSREHIRQQLKKAAQTIYLRIGPFDISPSTPSTFPSTARKRPRPSSSA